MKLKLNYYKNFCLILIFGLSTNLANAQNYNYNYQNPLKVNSISEWLQNFLAGVQGLVGVIAVAMIVIAGIIYMFSGANSSWITTAKNMTTWAMVGFTVAIAAPSLLKEIVSVFNGTPVSSDIIKNATPIGKILTNVLSFLLTIIGILALISFVIGGFQYLSSGGDRGKTESAKKILLYSMLAILISGSGAIIVRQIFALLVN